MNELLIVTLTKIGLGSGCYFKDLKSYAYKLNQFTDGQFNFVPCNNGSSLLFQSDGRDYAIDIELAPSDKHSIKSINVVEIP